MQTLSVANLNRQFGIEGRLRFETGPGGFPFAHIDSRTGSARVCLYGGHVTAFVPTGEAPVIWLSSDATYSPGKAIRGGIPICWPWFADHPNDSNQPAHGVARTSPWTVSGVFAPDEDTVRLELRLPSEFSAGVAPGVEVQLSISVSADLELQLTTTNHSEDRFVFTEALHSYLQVGSIDEVKIEGLTGAPFLDKVDGYREKVDSELIEMEAPTDRIYENTTSEILVHDPAQERRIRIDKSGSKTTVVWNPWKSGAKKMSDFPDEEYRTMVCVEAANARNNQIVLEPGASHVLGTTLSIE